MYRIEKSVALGVRDNYNAVYRMIERKHVEKNNRPDVDPIIAGSVDGFFTNLRVPRTQGGWYAWLLQTEAVEGDLWKKARLMREFQRGVDYVEAEAVKRGMDYKRPAIGIITTERAGSSFPPRVGAILGERIFVAAWYLEKASQRNLEQPMDILGMDEQPAYAGATVPDYFLLYGVEEAHHTLFHQREGEILPRVHPSTTQVELYDAQDHEYEALQWKIEAARVLGFPEKTVETLQYRLQAATAVRIEQAASAGHAVARQEPTSEEIEGPAQDASARNADSQEKIDDPQAVIPGYTPESTETLRDTVNLSPSPEELGLDEDEKASNTQHHFEEIPPMDNERIAGEDIHSPKGAARCGSRGRGVQDATDANPTKDTARTEQDYKDGR